MKFKINIYSQDTEHLVAVLSLNEVLSNKLRNELGLSAEWDNYGEWPLNEMIEDHYIHLPIIQADISRYSYSLEQINENKEC